MTTLQEFADAFSDEKLDELARLMMSRHTGELAGDRLAHLSRLLIENYNAEFDKQLFLEDITPDFLEDLWDQFTIALLTRKLLRAGRFGKKL